MAEASRVQACGEGGSGIGAAFVHGAFEIESGGRGAEGKSICIEAWVLPSRIDAFGIGLDETAWGSGYD